MSLDIAQKIALGTVQFGLPYGIQSGYSQVSQSEVKKILSLCLEKNITTLDTASAYGESEEVLGKVIQELDKDNSFKIISKVREKNEKNVEDAIVQSLKDLKVSNLYGYLIHNVSHVKENPNVYTPLLKSKQKGQIEKIGMSFYFPEDLEYVLGQYIPLDLVQLPFSILDRRFKRYLPQLKKLGIEVHIRSVFLQGIIFRKADSLPSFFEPIKNTITSLQSIAKNSKIPLHALAILFCLEHSEIDKLVLGVHTVEQLTSNLDAGKYRSEFASIKNSLKNLAVEDENMTVPLYWPA